MKSTKSLLYAFSDLPQDMIDDAALPATARRTLRPKRLAALLTAAALCAALAVPALAVAADNEPAYQALYALSPSLAQKLKPVQMSCEDQGIRMEVVSALVEGNTAAIQISMQDLTGDRIDETADLFDSYTLRSPFDQSASCQFLSYDPESKTAVFLLSISQPDGADFPKGKLTFSVRQLLSHKQEWEGPLSHWDLSALPQHPETQSDVSLRGWSGELHTETPLVLQPQAEGVSPAEGVTLTAAGWINRQLHLQTRYTDILRTDNHGYLELHKSNGEILSAQSSISFWDEDGQSSFEEEIFHITPEELADCTLYGHFWTGGQLTEGNWQVTFPLTEDLPSAE